MSINTYNAYNPSELKDVILQSLGAPIVNVEVTEDQIYMCIQKALELFGEYHFNGLNKAYKVIKIGTDEDLAGAFDLSKDNVFAVTQIVRAQSLTSMFQYPDGSVPTWMNDMFMPFFIPGGSGCSQFYSATSGIFGGSLGYLEQVFQRQKMLRDFVDPLPDFWYNDDTGQLKIFKNFKKGEIVIIEVWTKPFIDIEYLDDRTHQSAPSGVFSSSPNSLSDIYQNANNGLVNRSTDKTKQGSYNNRWVKEYAINLVKNLQGTILAKHQGLNLPGSTTIDGVRLIEESNMALRELREELEDLDIPVGIIMG